MIEEKTVNSSRLGHLMGDLKGKSGNLMEAVRKGAHELDRKSFSEIREDCGRYVKHHPGRVILASMALGALIVVMNRRKAK
jgi:hypothetical protein